MSRSLLEIRRTATTCGGRAECVVILHPRFPDRHLDVSDRNESHSKRVAPRLTCLARDDCGSFKIFGEEQLLLRLDRPRNRLRFVPGEPKLVAYRPGLYFLDHERRL